MNYGSSGLFVFSHFIVNPLYSLLRACHKQSFNSSKISFESQSLLKIKKN